MVNFNHRANVLVVIGWYGLTKLKINHLLFILSFDFLHSAVTSMYVLRQSRIQKLESLNFVNVNSGKGLPTLLVLAKDGILNIT